MAGEVLNFIDGEWVRSGSGQTFESHSPSTGELVATAQASTGDDIDAAVRAATRAFTEWSLSSGRERAEGLFKLAALLRENVERLAELSATEMGKPIRFARDRELMPGVERLEWFAGAARTLRGSVNLTTPAHQLNLIVKEPVGVCALITPWNDPVDLALRKIGACLAAGCTFVLKPSNLTPRSSMAIFELFEQIPELPRGAANGVTGAGEVVGEALATHPDVAKISFTGGTTTGKRLVRLGAETMKRFSMELGGKAPLIVFADANKQKALDAARLGSFMYAGQSCTAGTRLLIDRSIKDEFQEQLVEETAKLKVGDPLDPETYVGPIASEAQLERVLGYIESGRSGGATVLLGGDRLTGNGLGRGYFVAPTIFDGVTPAMTIAREEIFGPVLAILPFTSDSEAVAVANDTAYGLACSIWTQDVSRAIATAKAVRCGEVWVNTHYNRLADAPFGGMKESGIGRELGIEGIEEYMETKRILFDTASEFHLK